MPNYELTINQDQLKEGHLYFKQTVTIHLLSKIITRKDIAPQIMREFSLLDDLNVKCRPQVSFKEGKGGYWFEIVFLTPVPSEYKYEISLYYLDKLNKVNLVKTMFVSNVKLGSTFSFKCNDAFAVNETNVDYANKIDGAIVFYSKFIRADYPFALKHKPTLLLPSQVTDCSLLFCNKILSDLSIVIDRTEFYVHKEILAAKSPVFLAMFKNEIKEKQEKQIIIVDINKNVFQELLRYIYTNKVNNLNEHAESLLSAACKYDMSKLKLICIDELTRSLSVANAVHILLLADRLKTTILKRRVIDFIKGRIHLIFQTEGYKRLCQSPHAYLLSDILHAIAVE